MTNNRRLYACACLAGPMVDAGLARRMPMPSRRC